MKLIKWNVFILIAILVMLILEGGEYAAGMVPPEEEWNQTYGDKNAYHWPDYVKQIAEDGYIIFANMEICEEYPNDIRMIKADSQGNIQWSRILGGPYDDRAEYMIQTNDSGYLIAVKSLRNTNFSYIWLLKIDFEGNEQWNTTVGQIDDKVEYFRQDFGRTYSSNWPESLQQIPDDGYIVLGSTSLQPDQETIWVVKLDSTGNVQWNQTLGTLDPLSYDEALTFDLTYDNSCIVMKITTITDVSGFTLVKYDSMGKEQWNRSIEGYSGANSVQQTEDGGYIVSGVSLTKGILLLKTNSDGLIQWNRSYDRYIIQDYLLQTYDGGYLIAGINLASGTLVIKTDSVGLKQWNNTYEDIIMNFIQQTSDGGYIIAGHERIESDCFGDYVLLRIDSKGNEQWRRVFKDLDVDIFGWSKSVMQTSDSGYILVGGKYLSRSRKDIKLIKLKREDLPSASFTYYPKYKNKGQIVTFDASSSYAPEKNITHYQWNFGDGTIMNTTEKISNHSYTSEGIYTVNLTILSNKLALHSLTKIIRVQNITEDSDNRENIDFWSANLEVNHTQTTDTGLNPEISGFMFLISTGSLVAVYFILRNMEKK